ncbi:MAG TPA: aspartyl protease family protein [Bryobacteraceae bacterium]|nr:aspartyl protease family protein [Bryobacteraceae bacterium]
MWQNTAIRTLILSVIAAAALAASVQAPSRASAQADLYAARWNHAAESYRQILAVDPAWAEGWDGLVRALLEAHRSGEAFVAADEAAHHAPGAAPVETALGRVAFRRGDITAAEREFRAALKADPNYAGALHGMAAIHALWSRFATARTLEMAACKSQPGDPELIRACADATHGPEHIAALERALGFLDASTREARDLRAHIVADKALGDRSTRVLESPYRPYELNLLTLSSRPSATLGLRVRFNNHYTATLLLDTGADGISLTRKAARKAGLEELEREGTEAHGVGDGKPANSFTALARAVEAGGLALSNYPVQIFDAARTPEHDGIIGTDVFSDFVIEIDPRRLVLRLTPYEDGLPDADSPRDAAEPPPGFHRVLRRGHLLMAPTRIDDGAEVSLFLLDTGAALDLIDIDVARDASKLHGNARLLLTGVQGGVGQVERAGAMSFAFAGVREQDANTAAISLRSLSDEEGLQQSGILGMPALAGLKLTLDYRAGAVRLQPSR